MDWRIARGAVLPVKGPKNAWQDVPGHARKAENNDMRTIRQLTLALAAGAAALALAGPAFALDDVSFGTNWLAEAEHGGFYQAVADGTYTKYGLNVTIVQGGPQAANRQLELAGKVTFYMAGNFLEPFDAAAQGIPLVEVAAIFQKDPQIIMAHPDAGVDAFADLAKLPTLFLGKDFFVSDFAWMKSAFPGFKDEQFKPYNFNPGPFIADKNSGQQGYATSRALRGQGRRRWLRPQGKVFLLADNGWSTYSTMIETTQDYVAAHKDVVQRFVDASAIGWYNYLYGDNSAANALIKKDNPDMTDDQIAFSIRR